MLDEWESSRSAGSVMDMLRKACFVSTQSAGAMLVASEGVKGRCYPVQVEPRFRLVNSPRQLTFGHRREPKVSGIVISIRNAVSCASP